jgi:hypothetical protein
MRGAVLDAAPFAYFHYTTLSESVQEQTTTYCILFTFRAPFQKTLAIGCGQA